MVKKGETTVKETTEILLEGVENEVVENKLRTMLEDNNLDAEFDEVKTKFVTAVNGVHCRLKVKGVENKLTYGVKTVKGQLTAGQNIPAKPTMPISCKMRNLGTIVKNSANVTEETKDYPKEERVGIAGSWRRCLSCNRIWDTSDPRYGQSCPKCQSLSSVVLAYQAAPTPTTGIMDKNMRTGDISAYNTITSSIFYLDEGEVQQGFLKFSGKQKELLGEIRFGESFDINISAVDKDIFVNGTTGLKYFSVTSTSKVSECTNEMPDILEIYESMFDGMEGMSLIHSADDAEDGTFCTFYLQVVGEAKQHKEGGKWVVNLEEPTEDEDEEPIPITMYVDSKKVAQQFKLGDSGVFECRYAKETRTINDVTKTLGTINVEVSAPGVPVYLLSENGTKLVLA